MSGPSHSSRRFRALFWGAIAWITGSLLLSGCGRLDSIPYEPRQTPDMWLARQPFAELGTGPARWILVQPSSTVLVYLLGMVAVGAALFLWRIRGSERSRAWWSVALVLWGLGALFAGTSYQAFSDEIKCAGRAVCAWTSWWEVAYLVLSAASVDAMVVAVSYSSAPARLRRVLLPYALAHALLYTALVLAGALVPVQFLISFELLLLVAAPNIVLLLALNTWRHRVHRNPMDLALVGGWIWLGVTLAAYFVYLVLGVTGDLWRRGIWFSENDVLHIGLIGWMIYLAWVVSARVRDREAAGTS